MSRRALYGDGIGDVEKEVLFRQIRLDKGSDRRLVNHGSRESHWQAGATRMD